MSETAQDGYLKWAALLCKLTPTLTARYHVYEDKPC